MLLLIPAKKVIFFLAQEKSAQLKILTWETLFDYQA
jgi:hypothetical protein